MNLESGCKKWVLWAGAAAAAAAAIAKVVRPDWENGYSFRMFSVMLPLSFLDFNPMCPSVSDWPQSFSSLRSHGHPGPWILRKRTIHAPSPMQTACKLLPIFYQIEITKTAPPTAPACGIHHSRLSHIRNWLKSIEPYWAILSHIEPYWAIWV